MVVVVVVVKLVVVAVVVVTVVVGVVVFFIAVEVETDDMKVRPGYLDGSKLPLQASACPSLIPQSPSQPAREGRAAPCSCPENRRASIRKT